MTVDFRALVEGTSDMVAVFDREHRYVYVNAAFERATGIAGAQILGRLAGETRTPEAVDRWHEALADVFANHAQRVIEHALDTPHGRRRFSTILTAVGDHACAFSRDVTEIQAMQQTAYLAKAGEPLQHFDPEATLQAIVDLAVPDLADRAFIHPPEDRRCSDHRRDRAARSGAGRSDAGARRHGAPDRCGYGRRARPRGRPRGARPGR